MTLKQLMSAIPRTKTEAAAFVACLTALGAFILVLAQAIHAAQCSAAPIP